MISFKKKCLSAIFLKMSCNSLLNLRFHKCHVQMQMYLQILLNFAYQCKCTSLLCLTLAWWSYPRTLLIDTSFRRLSLRQLHHVQPCGGPDDRHLGNGCRPEQLHLHLHRYRNGRQRRYVWKLDDCKFLLTFVLNCVPPATNVSTVQCYTLVLVQTN